MSGDGPHISEAALNAATDAFYKAMIARAKELIAKRHTAISDIAELFDRIQRESETAQVLIFGSYLEDRFEAALSENLVHLEDSDSENRLFGSFGPLSSFGNQILLAYHLGWLSNNVKSRLDAFRKIRNEFAHNAFRTKYSDHSISGLIRRMAASDDRLTVEKMVRAAIDGAAERIPPYSDKILRPNDWVLCYFALLAGRAIEELHVLPVSKELGVNPEDLAREVWGTGESDPVRRPAVRAVLEVYFRSAAS